MSDVAIASGPIEVQVNHKGGRQSYSGGGVHAGCGGDLDDATDSLCGQTPHLALATLIFAVLAKDTFCRVSCTAHSRVFSSTGKVQLTSLSTATVFTFASGFAAATAGSVAGTHKNRW
jgi:hypothetical protein